MKSTSMIVMASVLVLLPAALRAQPAPIRNPVVERAPCGGAERVHANDVYAAGLLRARYDVRTGADTRRHPTRRMVPAASATDVRRDIVLELTRGCR